MRFRNPMLAVARAYVQDWWFLTLDPLEAEEFSPRYREWLMAPDDLHITAIYQQLRREDPYAYERRR